MNKFMTISTCKVLSKHVNKHLIGALLPIYYKDLDIKLSHVDLSDKSPLIRCCKAQSECSSLDFIKNIHTRLCSAVMELKVN